eukprot:11167019-Lingulodinium_polyedra.AAC.1
MSGLFSTAVAASTPTPPPIQGSARRSNCRLRPLMQGVSRCAFCWPVLEIRYCVGAFVFAREELAATR